MKLIKTPLVSIIIVNYNGRPFLDDCLSSLKKIDYTNIEIILVDNFSTDTSLDFVKKEYPNIICIELDKNYGFAKPNNLGTKVAKGKYFLFLNNDTIVEPNFVSELIKIATKDQTIGILQSLLLKSNGEIDSSGDFIDEIGIVYNSKTQVTEIRQISSARGASMMIQKDIFKKCGGFDEKFFVSFEDVDLGWRVWILGYKVVLVPTSIVYHIGGKTIRSVNIDLAFHGLKNQLSMKITNFESKFVFSRLVKFFIIYGLRESKIWLDYRIKGSTNMTSTSYEDTMAKKPSMKTILKSLFWIISNMAYLWNKHKTVNNYRIKTTKELQTLNIISNKKQ